MDFKIDFVNSELHRRRSEIDFVNSELYWRRSESTSITRSSPRPSARASSVNDTGGGGADTGGGGGEDAGAAKGGCGCSPAGWGPECWFLLAVLARRRPWRSATKLEASRA
jgi:hypothetical protein